MRVKPPFVFFRRVFSIENAELFCLSPCPSRASKYKMSLRPSENTGTVDVSDSSSFDSTARFRIEKTPKKTRPHCSTELAGKRHACPTGKQFYETDPKF